MEPMAGIEPATDGLRNRCSTAELHWLPLSTNSHVANVLHFGRVKVNGKPIRQASGPRLSQEPPPASVANELAPDANARTMCSLGTQPMRLQQRLARKGG